MIFSALKTPRGMVNAAVLIICGLMPVIGPIIDEPFFVDVFARTMIWAIAAVSLNLIMGYGGMISFGHAVYLGVGGYVVGILAFHEVTSGWIQWPLALLLSGLFAFIFGAISLRTRGVYFIMITLALAQMVYFLASSAEQYGSDDGLTIETRSDFGVSWFDLNDATTFYYVIFFFLLASLFVTWRMVNSRFGMVVRGIKSNETRMAAIGFPIYRYRLTAFVIAGVIGGLAGILSANFEGFVSPDMMYWTKSGDLIFMVVLGGMGSLFGPLTGALTFWMLSEILSNWTENWHLIFGPFLILVVLFARGGIDGFLARWDRRDG